MKRTLILLSVSALAVAGCEDGGPLQPEPGPMIPVASVHISPGGALSLEAGGSRTLGAATRAADGTELSRVVAWQSSDTTVAAVSPSGVLTARRAGAAVITATSEGKAAELKVYVAGLVQRVEIEARFVALTPGQTQALVASVRGAGGAVLSRLLAWESSNPAVATVSAAGVVTAVAAGSARITATSEGKVAEAEVAVGTWSERRLLSVGDSALPATLFASSITEGQERARRFEATAGTFRTLGSGYELAVTGWLHVEGRPATQTTLRQTGSFLYDVWSGEMMLYGEGADPNTGQPQFRGEHSADGTLAIRWRSEPGLHLVRLAFAAR